MGVRRRARRHPDRAGEPLDGLVNMFDLGIVLAVAFLIAGIGLSEVLDKRDTSENAEQPPAIVVGKDQRVVTLKPGERRVPVTGAQDLGRVYRLPSGQLVYVTGR
jgi:hypothetical protein